MEQGSGTRAHSARRAQGNLNRYVRALELNAAPTGHLERWTKRLAEVRQMLAAPDLATRSGAQHAELLVEQKRLLARLERRGTEARRRKVDVAREAFLSSLPRLREMGYLDADLVGAGVPAQDFAGVVR